MVLYSAVQCMHGDDHHKITAQLQMQGERNVPRDFMLMVWGIPLGAIWEVPGPTASAPTL